MSGPILITGGLLRYVQTEIHSPSLQGVDILCSYIKLSGVKSLRKDWTSLANRQIPIRLITTRQHNLTEQKALDELTSSDLNLNITIKMFTSEQVSFHVKGWLFHHEGGKKAAIVGSSNLSGPALGDAIEWNVYMPIQPDQNLPEMCTTFESTFNSYWNQADERFHDKRLRSYDAASWKEYKCFDHSLVCEDESCEGCRNAKLVEITAHAQCKNRRSKRVTSASTRRQQIAGPAQDENSVANQPQDTEDPLFAWIDKTIQQREYNSLLSQFSAAVATGNFQRTVTQFEKVVAKNTTLDATESPDQTEMIASYEAFQKRFEEAVNRGDYQSIVHEFEAWVSQGSRIARTEAVSAYLGNENSVKSYQQSLTLFEEALMKYNLQSQLATGVDYHTKLQVFQNVVNVRFPHIYLDDLWRSWSDRLGSPEYYGKAFSEIDLNKVDILQVLLRVAERLSEAKQNEKIDEDGQNWYQCFFQAATGLLDLSAADVAPFEFGGVTQEAQTFLQTSDSSTYSQLATEVIRVQNYNYDLSQPGSLEISRSLPWEGP